MLGFREVPAAIGPHPLDVPHAAAEGRMMVLLALLLLGSDPEPAGPGDKIVEFARSKLGEQVGDGECTALVAEALRQAGARRVRRGAPWGKPLESLRDVRPGDILQFESVVFVRKRLRPDGALVTVTSTYPHHTAIVAGVRKRGRRPLLAVLHQNAGAEGGDDAERKVVQQWTIDLADLRSGTIKAYRPAAE